MYEQLDDNLSVAPPTSYRKRVLVAVVCVLAVIMLAVSAALIVRATIVTTFTVDGISMYPTLDGGSGANMDSERENGEKLYLNKKAKIQRGDIVVFLVPDTADGARNYVKRVIAVGGDRLQIINNLVHLNGTLLNEPYINEPMNNTDDLDIIVENGYVFCMGDNRNHSADSRVIGAINLDDIIGKCFLIKGLDGKLRKP